MAHGGELRRGPLRRHLKLCVGCRDFQLAVSAQRQSLGVLLPVAPSAGLAAAILGHGAAHAVGAASVGGASAGAAGAGGTGIAASGTAAASTAVGAGAGGGTGFGALVGGGLVTKLAVGGAVVVLASAGAVTVHNRAARATANRAAPLRLAAASTAGRRIPATEIVDTNDALSGSLAAGSSTALHLVGEPGPANSVGSDPRPPATEPSGLGGVNPLLAPTAGTDAASGAAAPGSPGQLAGAPEKRKSGAGDPTARAKHLAELTRRKALLRRKATLLRRRASARRRALQRREALLRRRALRRRQLAERRRARREALEQRHRLAKPAAPKPAVTPTPTPTRVHHRKAPPATTPAPIPTPPPVTTSAPAETSTGNESKEVRSTKRHPKKHLLEEEKEKGKEEQQPPNLEAKPEVTGVDVQPTPTETETGGTHHAS